MNILSDQQLAMLFLGFIMFAIAMFGLGWQTAEDRERKALNLVENRFRALQQREEAFRDFVQSNWPNEYEAYRSGKLEGYQAGILNASSMDQDE